MKSNLTIFVFFAQFPFYKTKKEKTNVHAPIEKIGSLIDWLNGLIKRRNKKRRRSAAGLRDLRTKAEVIYSDGPSVPFLTLQRLLTTGTGAHTTLRSIESIEINKIQRYIYIYRCRDFYLKKGKHSDTQSPSNIQDGPFFLSLSSFPLGVFPWPSAV